MTASVRWSYHNAGRHSITQAEKLGMPDTFGGMLEGMRVVLPFEGCMHPCKGLSVDRCRGSFTVASQTGSTWQRLHRLCRITFG
jgi:hypothetical protein